MPSHSIVCLVAFVFGGGTSPMFYFFSNTYRNHSPCILTFCPFVEFFWSIILSYFVHFLYENKAFWKSVGRRVSILWYAYPFFPELSIKVREKSGKNLKTLHFTSIQFNSMDDSEGIVTHPGKAASFISDVRMNQG